MDRRAVVGLAAAALAACDGGDSGDLVVGISWNNYQQPRWAKADGPAIIAAIEAAGGSVLEADAELDAEAQLQDVDDLIAQGADVLILLAQDVGGIQPALDRAADAGVPVIAYDRLIEDERAVYLSYDMARVGTLMAEEITAAVPEGNYAIVKGDPGDPNAELLRDSMTPVLDEHPGILVVCEDNVYAWMTERAMEVMSACLAAQDDDIQAVLSENDSMALGVVAALEAAGLAGAVPVTGMDGDAANLNQIARGTQLVTMWKDPYALGATAGHVAIQLAQGTAIEDVEAPADLPDRAVPPTGLGVSAFTTPGGASVWSIRLDPTPITRDNLDLVIDLGWETRDTVCDGVPPGAVEACG